MDATIPVMVTAEELPGSLDQRFAEIRGRIGELTAAGGRAPAEVADDETAQRVTDFLRQINAGLKTLETCRREAKTPYDDAGKAVQAYFGALAAPLAEIKSTMERRLTAYQVAKEKREREAAQAAAEAAAARARAMQSGAATREDLEDAEAAGREARAAERKAAGPLGHTRGDLATAAVRKTWTWEFTDIRTLDLESLRPHFDISAFTKAINGYMRANRAEIEAASPDPDAVLRGVRFFKDAKVIVR